MVLDLERLLARGYFQTQVCTGPPLELASSSAGYDHRPANRASYASPPGQCTTLCCTVIYFTVFLWVTSRSRTPAKLQYEPRVELLQHGYEHAQLNTACWPDRLPTETCFFTRNIEPSTPPPSTCRAAHRPHAVLAVAAGGRGLSADRRSYNSAPQI